MSRLSFIIKEYKFMKKMRKQRSRQGFSDMDCWNMNSWISGTFSKMLYHLRDNKHGAPELKFEEVEEFPLEWLLNEMDKYNKKQGKHGEELDIYSIFDRWYLILTRMAWLLEQADEEITPIDNEYADEFFNQVYGDGDFMSCLKPSSYDDNGEPTCYTLNTNKPAPELEKSYYDKMQEIQEYRESCKNEAFDLLKKYFWALWD